MNKRSDSFIDQATLIGVGIALSGIFLMILPHTSVLFKTIKLGGISVSVLIEEVGSACLIAGLLALTLERVLVSRLTEDVRHGVEAYYLTYGLPKEFADEVMYVRDLKLVRKDYTVRCRIWNDESPDRVVVEVEISYTVINYSSRPITYEQHMEIEAIGKDSSRIMRVSRTGADLSTEIMVNDPGTRYSEKVNVRPNARDPHNHFDYVIRKVFAKQYGADFLIMNEPAINVRFMLEEVPDDVDFEVSIGHRDKTELAVVPEDAPRSWRLDKAFFPGSGILFEWKAKTPS